MAGTADGGVPPTTGVMGADGCGSVIISDDKISDFEGGDLGLLPVGMRSGGWYSYNDGTATGMQSPAPMATMVKATAGGACQTMYAFKVTGSGFTTWGSGVGVDFVATALAKMPYDVSAYSGIRFMAKAAAPTTARFKVLDQATVPTAQGGTCAAMCSDNFGAPVTLTAEWKQYEIKFAQLLQEGWGAPSPAINLKEVLGIQFQLSKEIVSYELWIDEVAFIK